MTGTIFSALATVAVASEGLARYAHRHSYGIPYRPRIYGDYRYKEFIEKTAAPLYNRMISCYHSTCVNINRYGLRGPEPDEIEARKRILLMGESDIFGVKLPDERSLWSVQLQEQLDKDYSDSWDVLNGGHPGYNSTQHLELWKSKLMREVFPDILLLRLGGNDLSQAYTMGKKWNPDFVWPVKFLWAMNSAQTPLQKKLLMSCLYYMCGGKELYVRAFGDVVKEFLQENKEAVLDQVIRNHISFIESARARGIKVALLAPANLEDSADNESSRKALDCLNENWRSFSEGYSPFFKETQIHIKKLCAEKDVPYLEMGHYISSKYQLGTLFYDGVHWNARGHRIVADFLHSALLEMNWL